MDKYFKDHHSDRQDITLGANTGKVKVLEDGKYFVVSAPQVGGTDRCYSNFRCWLSMNGVAVPNSNGLMNVNLNVKDVIVSQGILELRKNDVLEVIMASNDAGSVLVETIAPQISFKPFVPSIIFSIYKI